MYLENYQALLACILNPELLPDMAINIIIGRNNKDITRKRKKMFKIVDTKLEKEYVMDYKDASDLLEMPRDYIYRYASGGYLCKKRYKISYI